MPYDITYYKWNLKIIQMNPYTKQKQKILRRGGKNTQNKGTKNFHSQDNHDGVITQLEPGILECEVNGP